MVIPNSKSFFGVFTVNERSSRHFQVMRQVMRILFSSWFFHKLNLAELFFVQKECTIQLVQASLLREGLQQLSPVYSSSSAPGMIVGTGVIGEEIGLSTFTEVTYDEQGKKKNDDQTYMFISVNGGISFSVVSRKNYLQWYELLPTELQEISLFVDHKQ